VIICPFGCGERLYPDGKHANAEAAEVAKHKRECLKLQSPAPKPPPAPAPPEPISDKTNSTRAHAWRLFAAHALAGLLASDVDTIPNAGTVRLAADYADQLLALHDTRFK